MVTQIENPEYATEAPMALGGPQEVRDDSLASIGEMGFTVREVG